MKMTVKRLAILISEAGQECVKRGEVTPNKVFERCNGVGVLGELICREFDLNEAAVHEASIKYGINKFLDGGMS